MTDWLRTIGHYVWLIGIWFIEGLVLLGVGWIVWSRVKLTQYRREELKQRVVTHIRESQRGRRPLWIRDREQNDQLR